MDQQLWILTPGITNKRKASGQTRQARLGHTRRKAVPFSTIGLLCAIERLVRHDFLLFCWELGFALLRRPEKVLQPFMGLVSVKEDHKCTKRHNRLPNTSLLSYRTKHTCAISGSYCSNKRTHTGHWTQTSNVGTTNLPMAMLVSTDLLSDVLFQQLILFQGKIHLQLTCPDEDYRETDCYEELRYHLYIVNINNPRCSAICPQPIFITFSISKTDILRNVYMVRMHSTICPAFSLIPRGLETACSF